LGSAQELEKLRFQCQKAVSLLVTGVVSVFGGHFGIFHFLSHSHEQIEPFDSITFCAKKKKKHRTPSTRSFKPEMQPKPLLNSRCW